MDIILELTKAIIGVSLLAVLAMYSQFLANTPEYKALSTAWDNLRGVISYSIDSGLRRAYSWFYQFIDNINGVKVYSVKYF